MGTKSASVTSASGPWTVLARHDWGGEAGFTTTLVRALGELDDIDGSDVLYGYVDCEAVRAVLAGGRESTGATEVRFDYEGYEIRVLADGTIAAR